MTRSISTYSEVEDRLDAEFYRVQYLELRKKIQKNAAIKLGSVVKSHGTGKAASYYPRSGEPILKVRNVQDGKINYNNTDYVPEGFYRDYPKALLSKGDIILTTTGEGSIGKVDFFWDDIEIGIVPELTKITINDEKADPGFIYTFLRSKYGKPQFMRWINRATGQTHLYFKDIENSLLIPASSVEEQNKVGDLVRSSQEKYLRSKEKIDQASKILDSFSGLGQSNFISRKTYTSTYSGLEDRIDTEFYQPKYNQLFADLNKIGGKKIKVFQTFNKRGIQPIYTGNAGQYKALTSQYIRDDDIDYHPLPTVTNSCFSGSKDLHLRYGDIVTYATGAYVGRTHVWLEKNIKAVASNHVNLLRVSGLNAIFVGFVLNSFIGQLQIRRLISGAAQAELYPINIDEIIVPFAPEKVQKEIANLYIESHTLREESAKLLKLSEAMIEAIVEK